MADEPQVVPSVENSSLTEPTVNQGDDDAINSLLDVVLDGKEPPVSAEPPATDPSIVQAPVTKTEEPPVVDPAKGVPDPAAKVMPPVGTPPVPATTPKADTELDAIQPPKNISPKKLEDWNALRTLAKTRGEQLTQAKDELEKVKPLVGKPDPTAQARVKELETENARFKALFTHEKDPEFIAKYDTPLQKNEEAIFGILKANGMDEKSLTLLKEQGLSKQPAKFWDEHILPKLPFDQRKQLEDALYGNIKLSKERKEALDGVQNNFETYHKEQAEKQTAQFQTYTNELYQVVDAMTKDIPWARVQAVPADATPEVKARLEKENAFYKASEARFSAALYPANARTRAEVALAACLSYKLADDLTDAQTLIKSQVDQIAQLTAKIEAVKNAGITSRAGVNAPAQSKNKTPALDLPDLDAITQGLAEAGAT